MIRETPGERRDRLAAADSRRPVLWVPDRTGKVTAREVPEPEEEFEWVDPEPRPRYGRKQTPGDEGRVMVASAARIEVTDRKAISALRRRRQAWQSEAWDYSYEVPEVGSTLDFVADLLSKLRLFPAIRPSPENDPLPVNSDAAREDAGVTDAEIKMCTEALGRLKSRQGGQSAIVGDMAFNFAVTGECYLHGHEEPADEELGVPEEEDWTIRSVDELVVQGDRLGLRTFAGSNQIVPLPDDDIVLRVWRRDRRFGSMAMAHMRRLLATCENLLLLDREVRSTSQTRLTNGFMLWPNGMSLATDATRRDGDGPPEDTFLDDLMDAQVTAVQEPGSAAAFAPINVQGPDAVLEKVRHVKIERSIDAVLDKRIEAYVLRVARGLPAPVEVTTGLQETTFANAAQVKDSEWDSYGEPVAVLIVDALTSAFFQWMLTEAGMDPMRARDFFVWFDPSACIAAPDPADNADHGQSEGLIKAEAWRRVKGFSEDDAPDDDEVMRLLLLKMSRQDPFVAGQMLRDSGIAPHILLPAPQSGVLNTATMEVTGLPAPTELPGLAAAATRRPAPTGAALGRRLMQIDRELRTRLRTAAEVAMRRVLERAGNRIKNQAGKDPAAKAAAASAVAPWMVAAAVGKHIVKALGLSDEALVEGGFHELASEFGAWIDVGYRQAITEIERALGEELDPAVRAQLLLEASRGGETATGWLEEKLGRLAASRLYQPDPGLPVVGESSSSIPEWIVRGALGLAGGNTVEGGDGAPLRTPEGDPIMGVATGPLVMQQVGGTEAYQWDYGTAPRQSFEPHMDLDGVTFETFDDDVLANQEGWPDTDFYFPGDHDGCVCDVTPIIILAGPAEDSGDGEPEG